MSYPLSPFIAHTTKMPFRIDVEKAEGVYIYDKAGNKYLDFISGISVSNIGHRHPKVVSAIRHQLDLYMHTMVYGEFFQDPQINLAEKLHRILPEGLDVSYFVNSGTEANEAALKLAKRYTGRHRLVSFIGAYHGNTHGSMSVSYNETKKAPFRPLLPGVDFIRFNEKEDLKYITHETAGVIIEPIQGDAGVRIPSPDYLISLKKRCNEVGALLIFDEIQTGFGRTGKLFAFEHYGVVPHILTIAKGFGGGMPIGAFVSSKEIMDTLTVDPALGHITTFGGHPVNCAAALANLEVLLGNDQDLIRKAEAKGELIERLLQHDEVIEIRRKGLFFAIQMKDAHTVAKVVNGCKEKGLLSYWFLSNPDSFRIAPPLTISVEEIQTGCGIIQEVFSEL
ncbi:aspartate aminotransferase family protein [Parvicella tangerina]|uniref:Putrescine aminotransferase n=1 Tax=Parvicella tangerina TaxID=2829795 RepID=A0A916JLE3_9FLAO|nr:aspartate aminotransferase family protein [Parvicella tangerina]CAG5078843.1 Putrescine aminotransferase [Parvicella tangerina]